MLVGGERLRSIGLCYLKTDASAPQDGKLFSVRCLVCGWCGFGEVCDRSCRQVVRLETVLGLLDSSSVSLRGDRSFVLSESKNRK